MHYEPMVEFEQSLFLWFITVYNLCTYRLVSRSTVWKPNLNIYEELILAWKLLASMQKLMQWGKFQVTLLEFGGKRCINSFSFWRHYIPQCIIHYLQFFITRVLSLSDTIFSTFTVLRCCQPPAPIVAEAPNRGVVFSLRDFLGVSKGQAITFVPLWVSGQINSIQSLLQIMSLGYGPWVASFCFRGF